MAVERKKFFDVKIPLLDTSISALAYALEDLNNKTVKYDLTRILGGKNVDATFIIRVKDSEAIAEIKSLRLVSSFIARMMRKNISYVEDSFSCKAKDSMIRIKPFLLTRKKVHRSVRKALRNKAHEFIGEFCSGKDCDEIFGAIISGQLQKNLSLKLKKIYPLALCEIHVAKIEK